MFAAATKWTAYEDEEEGFTNPSVETTIPLSATAKSTFDRPSQTAVHTLATNYSAIMDTVNPITNPNFRNDSVATKFQTDLEGATTSLKRNPTNKTLSLSKQKNVLVPLIDNSILGTVRKCEQIKSTGCSAFDNPWFRANCGICHEKGGTHDNKVHIGGLYNDQDASAVTKEDADAQGIKNPDYQPTVGKCAPAKFSINKAQCQRISRQLECEKKQNYEVPGCSQCVDDERFYYIPPGAAMAPIKFVVAGNGRLNFSARSGQAQTVDLTPTPTLITPTVPLKEGDVVYMKVIQTGADAPSLSAYIYAPTVTGEYRMDIARLADIDLETRAKPRFFGIADLNKETYNILRPGAGKNAMNLQVYIPYTYLENNEPEARNCPSAPYLMNSGSAAKLNSGPCFVKGAAPGNYNLACIQQAFLAAGCTTAGKDYPKTLADARRLAGNKRIGTLANEFYNNAIISTTGNTTAGQKVELKVRHDTAQKCTGKSYMTPCDQYDPARGPLGADCLEQIYKTTPCRPEGLAAPFGKDGKPNKDAIAAAQKNGGIAGVTNYYRNIYARATNNQLKDKDREDALKQCYGTGFVTNPPKVVPPIVSPPVNSLLESPTANQKTPFARQDANYPDGVRPVVVLGRYGMGPWGGAGFSDKTAEWIWNTPNAQRDAPTYANHERPSFYYVFENNTNFSISARIDFMIDNIGDLYVNGKLIGLGHYGGWSNDYIKNGNRKTIELRPGSNLIKFVANNQGGPAGLLAACFGPNNVLLFHTDGRWRWKVDVAPIRPSSVTDLDNRPIWTPQNAVLTNLIDKSTNLNDGKFWNPHVRNPSQGLITYRVNFGFNRAFKLSTIVIHGFGDGVHDPTGIRVYTDSTKRQLIGNGGSMQNRSSAVVTITPANLAVNNVYIEFDKITAWQLWLKRVVFYGE